MMQSENRWEFYLDKTKLWQWRKFQDNRVVAVSSIGYTLFKDCVANATSRGYVAPTHNAGYGKR